LGLICTLFEMLCFSHNCIAAGSN